MATTVVLARLQSTNKGASAPKESDKYIFELQLKEQQMR